MAGWLAELLTDSIGGRKIMTRIIDYTPDMKISNTKYLTPGLGLRYLEVIEGNDPDVLIAKCWHREMPKNAAIVVRF
jgi:hypothetical protein